MSLCVWGYWNLCLLHSLRLTILEKDCLVKNTIFVPKLERQWHLTVSFVETMILAGLLKVLDQNWKLQDIFQGLIASFHGLMTECVYVNSWVCSSVSLLIHVPNVLRLPTWKKCPISLVPLVSICFQIIILTTIFLDRPHPACCGPLQEQRSQVSSW